jgi:hypothetical protein
MDQLKNTTKKIDFVKIFIIGSRRTMDASQDKSEIIANSVELNFSNICLNISCNPEKDKLKQTAKTKKLNDIAAK